MALLDLMLKRRSIRKFTGEEIPEEKLDLILKAALLAPTGRGVMPWEFYIIKDKEILKRLSEAKSHGAKLVAGCNTAIAVFIDPADTDVWIENCSIAMAYIELMAAEQGIGSCWIQMRLRKDEDGGDAEKNVKEILQVPENYRMSGLVALGIPDEHPEPHKIDELKWEKIHR